MGWLGSKRTIVHCEALIKW